MYVLLTGATGLLGRYLLRDLLLQQIPVAVVARPQRRERGADRIETILARWERALGRRLPRPVILDGSLNERGLGFSKDTRDWLSRNCTSVIHSAASLKFAHDPETNEPWTSNVGGTEHMLDFCEAHQIREFHYVSTAYVAGLRQGRVLESELNVGQTFGNVYEESKCRSETLVRQSSFLTNATFYRPSIIVGDSETGYTSTYHGFYTPLRLAYSIAPKLPRTTGSFLNELLHIFGLKGPEHKNLVPVDWVSSAMLKILTRPDLHGTTYHLSAAHPVTVAQMYDTFIEAIDPILGTQAQNNAEGALEAIGQSFYEQMQVYQAYWRNDPAFDQTNFSRAVPDFPSPTLDHPQLRLLSNFAIRDNFGWPSEPIVPAQNLVADALAGLSVLDAPAAPADVTLGFDLTGPGGTQWHLVVREGSVVESAPGLSRHAAFTFYLPAETFLELKTGAMNPQTSLETGRIVALGTPGLSIADAANWLKAVVAGIAPNGEPQLLAGSDVMNCGAAPQSTD